MARDRVERTRRLVREDHVRPGHQCPRHGDPLLLAAGELARAVTEPVADAEDGDGA
ncbi:hypothetical protein GCM10025862_00660 [Arsenicicoccus piscis]|uniref:Uncharacterized protein n=1 Tax=Arsenicicoccus piscis TaxID=673954 RepID=A0ABQ6HKC8_9MICO|nr:hypothetical protein GCM10025862_00660 [Arsenicicoccus piscis]